MNTIQKIYHQFCSTHSVFTDTRKISGAGIFFALKGDHFNGNLFAEKALNLGCTFAVIDDIRFAKDDRYILVDDVLDCLQQLARYHRDQLNIPVIGVTGSNGKTTTKELLVKVLSSKYKVSATKGNFNNHIGVPLSLLDIGFDAELAIIEMGTNSPGEIEQLCHLANPTHGVITSIGKAHLEQLIDINGVLREKTALYRHVMNNKGPLYINRDDELLMSETIGYPDVNLYSTSSLGSRTDKVSTLQSFPAIELMIGSLSVRSEMYGKYNILNMCCAAAIGLDFDVSVQEVVAALQSYIPSNNRTQKILEKDHQIYLDAYNANPSSMKEAILEFGKENSASKILVLGAMKELGDQTKMEHALIYQLVKSKIWHYVLFFGKEWLLEKQDSDVITEFDSLREKYNQLDKSQKEVLIKGSRSMALERLVLRN